MTNTNGTSDTFIIEPGLRLEHVELAAKGYWKAFYEKLRVPLGPESKATRFLTQALDPSHAISAVSNDGRFLGVAGFKTPVGAFVGGGFNELVATYGLLGGTLRGLLISPLERKCEPDTLLMDGIFVQEEARGLGVGTALLNAILKHASDKGLGNVRLDVINTNHNARRLYEKLGFREKAVYSLGMLQHVFGFQSATTMIRNVGSEGQ